MRAERRSAAVLAADVAGYDCLMARDMKSARSPMPILPPGSLACAEVEITRYELVLLPDGRP